jgi:predicted DNA-binding transcriptional regulator AlpA
MVSRIRPDDVLIDLPMLQIKMGNVSVSTIYDDPDLMALKISLMPDSKSTRTRSVRWIERETDELRARRVARSEQHAAATREKIEQRRDRRRAKQRATAGAPRHTAP